MTPISRPNKPKNHQLLSFRVVSFAYTQPFRDLRLLSVRTRRALEAHPQHKNGCKLCRPELQLHLAG